jgi:acetyl/propionyl-CoA carboxylase alpha subunit
VAAALWFEASARRYGHDPARTWSSSGPLSWPLALEVDGKRRMHAVNVLGPRRFRVEAGAESRVVELADTGDAGVHVRLDGRDGRATHVFDGDTLHLTLGALDLAVRETLHEPRAAAGGPGVADNELRAPMNGKVVAVLVAEGEAIAKGQRLVVVEAMKMQHEMTARAAGTVTRLAVKPGDQVANRQLLVELKIEG